MNRFSTLAASTAFALPVTAALADGHQTPVVTSQHAFTLETVATGLEHPWGLDFLPDGQMIVTERPGRIRVVAADGTLSEPLANVPEIVSEFRDGLFDVTVSPDFANDSRIFFSYSAFENGERWLQIASATLAGNALEDVTVIFESDVRVEKDQGFGSRIRFDADGNLVISVGDHAEAANAQDNSNILGTIIHITADGTPVGESAILANGFKNVQGMTIDPTDGTIWAADHGGTGGGELNHVHAGGNYGWPMRTFGINDAPRAAVEGDFVDPIFTWGVAPTVALSGLEVYTGDDFPFWQGDLFAGSLVQQALIRVMLDDNNAVIGTEYVLDGHIGRVREVRQGPDGMLYVLNDDVEGSIFRIAPTE